jgi:hypothetical protein
VLASTLACDGGGGGGGLSLPASSAHALARRGGEQAAVVASAARRELASGIASARARLDGLAPDGSLSGDGAAWLATARSASPGQGGLDGAQLGPVALDVAKVLYDVVELDVTIEPIVQRVEPGAEKQADARIAAMPRVELANGVEVGFQELTRTSMRELANESAVLVLWRRERMLLGMLYRSRRALDVERLVRDAPRLVARIDQALATK